MSITSSDYYIYTVAGHETITGICNTIDCDIQDVIRINTQPYTTKESNIIANYVLLVKQPTDWNSNYTNYYIINNTGSYEQITDVKYPEPPLWKLNTYYMYQVQENPIETTTTITVGQFLTNCQISGTTLPAGLEIRIPYLMSGGVTERYTSLANRIQQVISESTVKNTEKKYNVLTESKLQQLNRSIGDTWKKFGCFVIKYAGNKRQGSSMYLPVYPNEFSDSNSSRFSSVNLFGRSVDYQIYNGSERSINVVLNLHEELSTNYNYVPQLVRFIESACYPEYGASSVQVPEIEIVIGNHFRCRGILSSTSANWKAPIINNRLVNCDLTLSITETTGPYSMSQIARMGGYR